MNDLQTRDRLPPFPERDADAASGCAPPDLHKEWVEAMVNEYERPLLAYAFRLLGCDHGRAQDAVQETFLRLCREDRAQIEPRIAAWLFAVCRTRVIDMQRSRVHTMNESDPIVIADPSPDAAQVMETAEQVSKLTALVSTLTPRQQEVLRLRLQAKLSYREIAEITGLTVSNVGFHLHAAVRALRTAMEAV